MTLDFQLHKSETKTEVEPAWQIVKVGDLMALTSLEQYNSHTIAAGEHNDIHPSYTRELVSTKQEPRTS
jgi:hypothetical protein